MEANLLSDGLFSGEEPPPQLANSIDEKKREKLLLIILFIFLKFFFDYNLFISGFLSQLHAILQNIFKSVLGLRSSYYFFNIIFFQIANNMYSTCFC